MWQACFVVNVVCTLRAGFSVPRVEVGWREAVLLVDMIENQRSYEVQANLLKEAKSMDESSASLMRLPS